MVGSRRLRLLEYSVRTYDPTMATLSTRILKSALILLFFGVPLALCGAAFLAFSDHPTTAAGYELTPEHIQRAAALLSMHDPRKTPDGRLRTVQLRGSDVDLVAKYAASRVGGACEIVLQDREALIQASVPLRGSPVGGYLNVIAVIGETEGLPRFERLTVGRLPVPAWIANRALRYGLRRLSESDGHVVAEDIVKSVAIGDGVLRVEYEWRTDLPDRLRALAVPKEDVERLRAYHDRIVRVIEDLPPRRAMLIDIVRPVMQLAAERSAAGDAASENRIAIVSIAFYVIGKGPEALAPGAREWPRAQPRVVLLRGRDDTPMHFMVSAMLSAAAGTPLANLVGVYKEIDDSRAGSGGSGFSFSDIAADRSGTTFGERATGSTDSARHLQGRIGQGLAEADLIPEIKDLPDSISEQDFRQRFGAVGSPSYTQLTDDIERRVAACPLYQ